MAELSRTLNDHEFGGLSTDLKLSMVEGYLQAFTVALRPHFSRLVYIDAFAGTGARTVKHGAKPANLLEEATEARIERRRGSAQIALDVKPPFDELIFIDMKKSHHRALLQLAAANPSRSITVLRGDANTKLLEAIRGRSWSSARAVLFLDPYGMHVDWTTLEAVRKTGAIDVWYLVSLAGLYRQAPRERTKLTDKKRAAITRLLGTSEWEDAWYADKPSPFHLLEGLEAFNGPPNMHRTAEVDDIAAYVKKRLEYLFPAVLPPLTLKNNGGKPAFLLFFAVANPRGAAIGVATKIARHILKAGSSSQVLSR
jgi:three-Cys-motif partner protein